MPGQEYVVKIVADNSDAIRKIDEVLAKLKQLEEQQKALGIATPATAATARQSAATGYGIEGAAQATGGSIIAPGQRAGPTQADWNQMAEQAMARIVQNVGGALLTAGQKYAGGLPISAAPALAMGGRGRAGGGVLSSIPPHILATATPVEQEGLTFQQIEQAAATFAAEGVANVTTEQIKQRAQEIRLQATGTQGPTPIQMGAAAGAAPLTSIAGGRSRGGGGGGEPPVRGSPPPQAERWDPAIARETGGVWGGQWTGYGPQFDLSWRGRFGRAAGTFAGGVTEGFQAGNMAAFNALMAGWAIGSSAMPIEQVNAPALQAAQRFAYDPQRAAVNQRLQRAQIAYGRQVDTAQQGWDASQAGLLEWLAANNLGGASQNANNILGTITGAANLIQGPLLTGFLGAGAIRGGLSALGVQGGIRGGLAAVGGLGGGAVGAATGVGALAAAAMGIRELIEQATGGGAMANLASAAVQGPILGPLTSYNRWAIQQIGGLFGGQAAQAAPAAGGYAVQPFRAPDIPPTPQQFIIGRLQAEQQRQATDPFAFAAAQEMAGRAQTGYGLAGAQFRLGISAQQMAISRRNFDEDQAREREQLGIDYNRTLRDIQIGGERARQDLGISVGRQRADVARNLGINQREIGIGYGESVEDINRQAGENEQDILFGSALTGTAGALVRNRIAQRRALAAAARGRDRALGRAGRGAGDAYAGIDIGAGRAEEDIALGEGRAASDATRRAADAGDDLARRQKVERDRYAEQEAINKQLLQIAQDELNIRKQINAAYQAGPEEIERVFNGGSRKLDAAFEKVANDLSRILEGMAP